MMRFSFWPPIPALDRWRLARSKWGIRLVVRDMLADRALSVAAIRRELRDRGFPMSRRYAGELLAEMQADGIVFGFTMPVQEGATVGREPWYRINPGVVAAREGSQG